MFINYSLERTQVKDLNPAFLSPQVLAGNPFLRDSLVLGEGNRRIISKIGPSYVYNTVDHPIFPNTGARYTLSFDVAGLGGNTKFVNPRAEAIRYFQHTQAHVARAPRPGRIHPSVRQHASPCRSSRSCSSAASTASAASICEPSVLATLFPASCSAATRACCSTLNT